MARLGLCALALAVVLVTAGCNGAGGAGPDATPAPVPTDNPPIRPEERGIVDLVNDRGLPHAVSMTFVEADVPQLEVTWANGTTTAVEPDEAGRATIRRQAASGDVRDIGLPDDIKSSYAVADADPGVTATVGLWSGIRNPTVIVEVRPVGDGGRSFENREPLLLAIVVDCDPEERFETVRISLGRDIHVDQSRQCVGSG